VALLGNHLSVTDNFKGYFFFGYAGRHSAVYLAYDIGK
jgi:hypothetical protein